MSYRVGPESILLFGTSPSALYGVPISGSVIVTSQHPDGTDAYPSGTGAISGAFTTYVEGVDYDVDYAAGTISRRSGSAIPDTAGWTSGSYGAFMPWVQYEAVGRAYEAPFDARLPRFTEKLRLGKPIKIAVLGDSITTGAEAERTGTGVAAGFGAPYHGVVDAAVGSKAASQDYMSRWARSLIDRFGSLVTLDWGAIWAEKHDVLANSTELNLRITQQVDLVTVAYGMNDASLTNADVLSYLRAFVTYIRGRFPNIEILLISGARDSGGTGSTRFDGYRTQMQTVAAENIGVAVADVTARWDAAIARKGTLPMLKNNSNHPTSFGHWIYTQALDAFVPHDEGTWKVLGSVALPEADFRVPANWQVQVSGYDVHASEVAVAATTTGGGTTTRAGMHAGSAARALTGGGTTTKSGKKGAQRAVAISGGGTTQISDTASTGSASGTQATHGGGTTAKSGKKGALRAVTISGGGVTSITGGNSHLHSITISGGGQTIKSGLKGASRAATISGGGATSKTSKKGALRIVINSGGGSSIYISGSGTIHGAAITCSGGGKNTKAGKKGAQRALVVSGGGTSTTGSSTVTSSYIMAETFGHFVVPGATGRDGNLNMTTTGHILLNDTSAPMVERAPAP